MSGNPDISLFIFSFLSSCIFTNNKLGNFVKFSDFSSCVDLVLIISEFTGSIPVPLGFTDSDFVKVFFVVENVFVAENGSNFEISSFSLESFEKLL